MDLVNLDFNDKNDLVPRGNGLSKLLVPICFLCIGSLIT